MNLKKSQFPFKVNKLPFFYGWVIVFAGIVGVIMSLPGQTMGVSVFTDYLIEALPVDRTSLSLTYLIGTIASGFIITRAGKLYDKYGARVMAMSSGFALGIILIGFTKIDVLVQSFSDNNRLAQIVAFILLVIGFFGIRFFGQGVLTMVSRNMVMKWFESRRGLANGIMGIFVSFGFSYSPRLFNHIIDANGWKGAWILIGTVVAIAFTIFAFIFFRDNAVDCGLKPDGNLSKQTSKKKLVGKKQFTLKEARKTYTFWVFTFTIALNALFVTALTFHIVSIFNQIGMDRNAAVSIFLPASFIAVSVNLILGWISDYIKLKYLVMLDMIGIVIVVSGIILLGKVEQAKLLMIVGYGLTTGLFSILNAVSWPRFYGTKHLGAITGNVMAFTVIASAVGPYLFSLSEKFTGNYTASALVCATMAALVFVFSFKANNINK